MMVILKVVLSMFVCGGASEIVFNLNVLKSQKRDMKLHSHKTVKIDQVKKLFVDTKKERKLKRDTKFVTYKRGDHPKPLQKKIGQVCFLH